MIPTPLEELIKILAKIPGFGRRSAQKATLHLLTNLNHLETLEHHLNVVKQQIKTCPVCCNLSTQSPCHICADPKRDATLLCVVEEVADLWAMERSGAFTGHYHVLGGLLSALDGIGAEEIGLPALLGRVQKQNYAEVILALSAGVDGQTTAHLINQKLTPVKVTTLAKGLPMGAEIDYMDEGTLHFALQGRRALS